MRFPATPGLGPPVLVVGASSPFLAEGPLVLVVSCPSPILAEGPRCGFPPILAGVRWFGGRRVVPRQSWLSALGAVPRHSWLRSAGFCGGWSLANPG